MPRESADFDVSDFESRTSADKNVYVKFYLHPVRDDSKSDEAGRPIFIEKEYVEIRTPGDQNNVIRRPVSDMDRERFRGAYRLFKEGHEEQITGTPLSEVSWVSRSQVEELAYLRVRTLEQLSELNDSVCSRHAGMYSLKQRAQKAVESAKSAAPMLELQKQLETLTNKLEAQDKTIADQADLIKKLSQAQQKA